MQRVNQENFKIRKPRKSAIAEIIKAYCEAKGIDKALKMNKEARKQYPYSRMAKRAKDLLELCGGSLGDALHMVMVKGYWL